LHIKNNGNLYIPLVSGGRAFITSGGGIILMVTGDITIEDLGAEKDIIIDSTGTVRIGVLESKGGFAVKIKSANGIYKISEISEETVNIICGDLELWMAEQAQSLLKGIRLILTLQIILQ
jgi:hypothetical protein